tara:strand:+ start:750849 stop:755399 length:4551 start_codon:yes stop_codon:yes gene_type:complete
MIYFHFCDTYINETNDSIHNVLKKLIEEFSNRESIKGVGKVASFVSGVYILKFKTPYAEIILQEKYIKHIDKTYKVYFIRGLKNGLKDYVEIKNGKWLVYNPLPDEEIEKFRSRIDKKNKKKYEFTPPPQDMTIWQSGYKLKVEYDVYESEEWVRFAMSTSLTEGMKFDEVKVFRRVVQSIVLLTESMFNEISSGPNFRTNTIIDEEIGVIFSILQIDQKNFFLLHNGGNVKTQADYWNKAIKIDYLNDSKTYDIVDLSSVAIKAYPSWALKDADSWAKIEKNNELGNLSLLPEQTSFLKNFKFPKFINGQAGSGKSTMLYYLFSNIYYYKYAGEIPGDLIFLTENERLLEHTKSSVLDLLINNPEFDLSSESDAISNVDRHFYPFKQFLLSFITDDILGFDEKKYLDFSKFKILYEDSRIPKHVKKDYSAELVWFTISTYVKGHSLDFQINSSNYESKMPKEGKELISLDDLKGMEKKVINPFYKKLLEDGYWDKISLIDYISSNIEINQSYDVIFCDEAQDFSKVELEFIMKLSNYTNYNLQSVDQFPIVFAGDALQTVNPTGFRPQVLTSMIFNELTNEKTGYNLDQTNLEFTPKYNYRSSQSIVNLANAIQNFRKEELDADIKSPQISKRPILHKHENLNVFVSIEKFTKDLRLQRKLEYKTIIVPVNNDEIGEFKRVHPILEKYDNIISSVDAKGLDFSEVAIFGFGKFRMENQGLRKYEKKYFFNKLYVGITRAQSELVIIDSDESKKGFWEPIIQNYINSTWAHELKPKLNGIEDLIVFDANEIIQSSELVLENDAMRQKEQGIIEENVPLLLVAASHFIKLGNKKQYFLTRGHIQELEGNWSKAADFYLNNEVDGRGIDRAMKVLWIGQLWDRIIKVGNENVNDKNQIKVIVSNLFLDGDISHTHLRVLYEKVFILKSLTKFISWKNDFIDKLLSMLNNSIDIEDSILVCNLIEAVCDSNNINVLKLIGKKYYELGKFQPAILLFEEYNIKDIDYLNSKLAIARKLNKLDEVIIYLGRLALEYKIDKNKIAEEIIETYLINDLTENNFNNIYVELYVYVSFLFKQPSNINILSLATKVEQDFINTERYIEIAEIYVKLLDSRYLMDSAQLFVLKRWAKALFNSGASVKSINRKYKHISLKNGFEYHAFSREEILNIPKIPIALKSKMPNHFKNINIKNFRGFKELTIKNIGLVNLIVGDNNIGKTSLLEAFLFTPKKSKYLKRLSIAYAERINLHPDKENKTEEQELYYNLDKNIIEDYFNANSDEKKISFNLSDNREQWNYDVSLKENTPHSLNNSNNYNIIFDEVDYEKLKRIPYTSLLKTPFIPFGKGFGHELSYVYDEQIRKKRDLEKEFLSNLRVFIPNVRSVFVNAEGSIEIRDDDYNKDMPLSQYGEGANKLFRILLLLTIHRGNKLLIDEIDAGIHFSRFKDFWRIILKISIRDNTQIIATTHNQECIRYLKEVLDEDSFGEVYQSKTRVVQMKKVNDIKVRCYEYDSFNLAFEEGVEIR